MWTFRLRTLLVGALVAAAGLALIAFDLSRMYQRDIRDAERTARNLTVALEADTRHAIQVVGLALAALAERPETIALLQGGAGNGTEARIVDALLQTQLTGLPQVQWVSLFDRQGSPAASSDRLVVQRLASIADRDYFRTLRSPDWKGRIFISAPFRGRASGRWIFVMSRRVTARDGSFAGVISAAFDPGYFPALYQNIDIGAHGNVALVHQNGTIIARSPGHEQFAGRSVAAGVLFLEHLPRADAGTGRIRTVLQDREILYSYSRVKGTPLVINVAFDMTDVLENWRQSLAVYAVMALGLLLLVAFATAAVLRSRARAEKERELSETTFRTLFDNASEGVLLADAQTGRFRMSNPAMRRMLGYSESEIAQLHPPDIHPPEQRAFVKEHFAAMARGEAQTLSAMPTLRKDGSVFYADISALQIEFGGRRYLAGLFRDVTAVREAQQALRVSEERLNEAQRIAQVGSWELDLARGTLTWSDEIFRLFEIDRAKFGATYEAFLNAIHPDDREAVNAAYTRSLETRERYSITHRLLMADGRIKYVHERCVSEFDAQGKPLRSMGTVQDVTAQRLAENALLVSQAAIETSINAIAMAGLDGRITYVNPAFLRLWRLERPEQAIGRQPREFTSQADMIIEAIQSDGRWQGDVPAQRPDGSTMDIHVSAHLVTDKNGQPVCLMASFLDISERKHAEEAIHQLNAELEQRVAERTAKLASANKELETFTYSVSHDLKGPLRGIDGYSRLLLEDYADRLDDEGRQFLRNVREGTQHMNQLLNDLLAYSRLERQDMQFGQVDLQALVQSLLAGHEAEIQARGVAVSVAVAVPGAPVSADREGLTMGLRNLLENALKFTRDTPAPAIEVGARDEGATCLLWVRDNGVGFDMQYHDRIFAIFQRLHRAEDYPGTGVGLAIVAKAMQRMGGRARAESEPGKGATFYLEIPR